MRIGELPLTAEEHVERVPRCPFFRQPDVYDGISVIVPSYGYNIQPYKSWRTNPDNEKCASEPIWVGYHPHIRWIAWDGTRGQEPLGEQP